MSLLHLPNELLIQIASGLDAKALYSLVLANRHLAALLSPELLRCAHTIPRHCVTALYLAAANRDENKIKQLLEKCEVELLVGVVFRLSESELKGPEREMVPMVARYLVAKGAESVVHDLASGGTPLHWAARCGHEVVFRRLLEQGAGFNRSLSPILCWAVHGENEAIVRLLLERGASVNAVDEEDLTALHLAAEKGSESIVRLLLENRAQVDIKDINDETALMKAVEAPNGEAVVKLLLKRGAYINFMDTNRNTALHRAVYLDSESMVRLLLENGAFPFFQNMDLKMPIHIAQESGNEVIVKMLEDSSQQPGFHARCGLRISWNEVEVLGSVGDDDPLDLLISAYFNLQ